MTIKISDSIFPILKKYIETQCGVVLRDSQKYLLESRLSNLIREHGCADFEDFYQLIQRGTVQGLPEKIINAMTTNETLWFRDNHPWHAFSDHLMPMWEKKFATTGNGPRIWSAAASTGQEAYSMAMLVREHAKKNRAAAVHRTVEILGTDISTSALYVAISGNYDEISMSRGFVEPWQRYKSLYFTQRGRVWEIDAECRKQTRFIHFNLQDSFQSLGTFDLICLRNVIIYFSDEFKRTLFQKLERCLNPGGYILLGASETPIRYTDRLKAVKLGISIYYQLKD